MASTPDWSESKVARWSLGLLLIVLGVGGIAFGIFGPHNIYSPKSIVIGCICVALGALVLIFGFARLNKWSRRHNSRGRR